MTDPTPTPTVTHDVYPTPKVREVYEGILAIAGLEQAHTVYALQDIVTQYLDSSIVKPENRLTVKSSFIHNVFCHPDMMIAYYNVISVYGFDENEQQTILFRTYVDAAF